MEAVAMLKLVLAAALGFPRTWIVSAPNFEPHAARLVAQAFMSPRAV